MSRPYVQLISNDGFRFVITREAALVSGTLKAMLSNSRSEERSSGIIHLDFDSNVLAKICDYFYFNLNYKDDVKGTFEIPPIMALELLVAADYLDA